MRILFLGLAPPVPATNGHRLRNRSLLLALAQEGHEVTLLCFADPEEVRSPDPELMRLCADLRLIVAPPIRSALAEYWGRLSTLFSRLPYGAHRLRSDVMMQTVGHELNKWTFDAIICDDIYMLANIPLKLRTPVLLNKHDLTHEIMARFSQYEKNPLKKLYARSECRKVRHLESAACTNSAMVLACSERDRECLQNLSPHAQVHVLPNVIDVETYVPSQRDEDNTVVFVGAMDWFPNCDAVEFFLTEILPDLRDREPNVHVIIAGRNAPASLCKRYSDLPYVEFLTNVPDMRPILAHAAVCIVPLRIGSGTRMKILEAAAMGKPVVSTRIGAEGLNFVPSEEIILADEPREFGSALAALLMDSAARQRLGQAARRRVEQEYSVLAFRRILRSVFEELMQTPLDTTIAQEQLSRVTG
jgi:glycosyltransferase involved in cell wall biosynthesis